MNNHWVGMNNLHLSKRALDSAINSNFVILTDCLKRTQLFFFFDFYTPVISSDANINCFSANF